MRLYNRRLRLSGLGGQDHVCEESSGQEKDIFQQEKPGQEGLYEPTQQVQTEVV
jgi:hypothetical protein